MCFLGFNTIETKIRTPDGKVWAEDDFQNLSREIYKDLTQQLTGIHGDPDCYFPFVNMNITMNDALVTLFNKITLVIIRGVS